MSTLKNFLGRTLLISKVPAKVIFCSKLRSQYIIFVNLKESLTPQKCTFKGFLKKEKECTPLHLWSKMHRKKCDICDNFVEILFALNESTKSLELRLQSPSCNLVQYIFGICKQYLQFKYTMLILGTDASVYDPRL